MTMLVARTQEDFASLFTEKLGMQEVAVQRLLTAVSEVVKRLKLLAESDALVRFV